MYLILAHGFISVKGARFLSRLKSQVSSRVFYEKGTAVGVGRPIGPFNFGVVPGVSASAA